MKRFRLFAGPNGAGKTSLVSQVPGQFFIGSFINADDLNWKLNGHGFVDLSEFLTGAVTQESWNEFVQLAAQNDQRMELYGDLKKLIHVDDNILTLTGKTDAYIASFIAAFIREYLLRGDRSFSFETVMSHPSKIEFLKRAREDNFKTYLYFISTRDPKINEDRVQLRVEKGGHNVDKDKIEARYFRSLELLKPAFLAADRAFIFDNSSDIPNFDVLVEKDYNKIKLHSNIVPAWIKEYLLDNL